MSSFWKALTTLKLLITFSTSVLLLFLKFSTESKFFVFILIILGCWSDIFVAIDNGLLIAFESTALFIKLGIFKLETILQLELKNDYWKYGTIRRCTFLSFFVRVNFFAFWVFFFEKRGTIIFEKDLLSLILLMSKLSKYYF